jgi:hypothetical protein
MNQVKNTIGARLADYLLEIRCRLFGPAQEAAQKNVS